MTELSSNWKKLQAKLKAEGISRNSSKRKISVQPSRPAKKPKLVKSAVGRSTSAPNQDGRQKRPPEMGGVHSSKIELEPSHGPSPSLALWAEDNDISAEALAEAYGLGLGGNSLMLASAMDKVNHGLNTEVDIGKYVAMDCEMVGVGPGAYESALARVSLVDFHGRQVYDSFVKPMERVTDWRTAVSGVSRRDMKFARDFPEVQQEIFNILKDRIVIGHDIKHDLEALKLSHPPRDIRDTAKHPGFRRFGNGSKPALRILAQELLGMEIQGEAHSSIEDARVTMLLFRKHKSQFDVDHASRYTPKTPTTRLQAGNKSKKKNRKK